jgi:hypothetical protein
VWSVRLLDLLLLLAPPPLLLLLGRPALVLAAHTAEGSRPCQAPAECARPAARCKPCIGGVLQNGSLAAAHWRLTCCCMPRVAAAGAGST